MAWLKLTPRVPKGSILVNTDHIVRVEPREGHAFIVLIGEKQLEVTETADIVEKRLTAIGEKLG